LLAATVDEFILRTDFFAGTEKRLLERDKAGGSFEVGGPFLFRIPGRRSGDDGREAVSASTVPWRTKANALSERRESARFFIHVP
jgi:hypothetical protein